MRGGLIWRMVSRETGHNEFARMEPTVNSTIATNIKENGEKDGLIWKRVTTLVTNSGDQQWRVRKELGGRNMEKGTKQGGRWAGHCGPE